MIEHMFYIRKIRITVYPMAAYSAWLKRRPHGRRRFCLQARKPQNSPYYQCVVDHLEAFEQIYEDRFERKYMKLIPFTAPSARVPCE